MSSIIKSFRVVESTVTEKKEEKKDNSTDKIVEQIISEATEKAKAEYDRIIKEAYDLAEKTSKQIIEQAEEKSNEIISLANETSVSIEEEAKQTGYSEGYSIGQKEGYETGFNEGKLVADELIEEAIAIKNSYIETKNNLLKELEPEIIELVISIYEKVINKKSEEDNELIVDLVLNGISKLDLTDKLTIICAKEDYNVLEMSKNEILAKSSMITELDIKYDMALGKGDCILETLRGNIDVSLKNQLDEVKELLITILNNE